MPANLTVRYLTLQHTQPQWRPRASARESDRAIPDIAASPPSVDATCPVPANLTVRYLTLQHTRPQWRPRAQSPPI